MLASWILAAPLRCQQWRQWEVDRPGWHRPGVTPEWKKIFLVAEFIKNTGESTSEGGRRQVKKGDDYKKVASCSGKK